VDVHETITIKEAPADLFAGLATDPTNTTAPQDVCRPPGYQFTGIWAYSTETNGAHTPGDALNVEVFASVQVRMLKCMMLNFFICVRELQLLVHIS
jgi:hypothetical protein